MLPSEILAISHDSHITAWSSNRVRYPTIKAQEVRGTEKSPIKSDRDKVTYKRVTLPAFIAKEPAKSLEHRPNNLIPEQATGNERIAQ